MDETKTEVGNLRKLFTSAEQNMKDIDELVITLRSALDKVQDQEHKQENHNAETNLKLSSMKREQTDLKSHLKESLEALKLRTEQQIEALHSEKNTKDLSIHAEIKSLHSGSEVLASQLAELIDQYQELTTKVEATT